jgi:hypothetical protein
MEKAYSYRFYPTPEQESLLRRTLGCVRLVYNKALHERTQAWYEKQERVGYTETSSMLTDWLFWFLCGNEVYTDSLFNKIVLKVFPSKHFTIS